MCFKFIDLVQGTPEWHEFRQDKIGASMAPVIMGVSPFQTRLELWEEIQFGKKRPKTKAMERGTQMEPAALQWINEALGTNYQPITIQSLTVPERIASLDGHFEKDGLHFLLEIKCPNVQTHLEAVGGDIPAHYYPQLQHQMDVAGVEEIIYLSFDGEKGATIHCKRDKKYCQKLFVEEMRFLESLSNFTPPDPQDKDWMKISDPELSLKAERLRELNLLHEEIDREKEWIKEELQASVSHPRSKIGELKIQKIQKKGPIDYGKIDVLKGLNLEAFRKNPVSYWKFSF